jgi:hypothetical protein
LIGQSFAIVSVILVMILMFLRGGRKAGALFSLPLLSVPLLHLTGMALRMLMPDAFSALVLNVAFDVAGFCFGSVICWIMARAITVRRLRFAYFASCAVFLGLLAAAYVMYPLSGRGF